MPAASIKPECEKTGYNLVWGLMDWEGEGGSMKHFQHEALDLESSTQEVLLLLPVPSSDPNLIFSQNLLLSPIPTQL